MQKTNTFVVAIALFCCFLSADLFAQTKKSNAIFAEILKSENEDISEETVAEIIAIRKRIGGGLGLADKDWFVLPKAKISNVVESDSNSGQIFLAAMENLDSKSKRTVGVNVGKLRAVARKMDELAADLEDLEMFDDADQIRNQAFKIRKQARKRQSAEILR